MKKNLASLFSGCGGMDLGFEGEFAVHKSCLTSAELLRCNNFDKNGFTQLNALNFETVFACDVNSKAKSAWDTYFSKRREITDQFRLASIVDIVKDLKMGSKSLEHRIHVVTGGFPCNDFSVAGKRQGFSSEKSHQGNKKLIQDADDPTIENRGMLYFWMREFIALTQPNVFYAENVKGLVSLGDAKEIITNDFGAVNGSSYHVLPVRVLKAIEFGVPQTRERVIFIGVNKSKLRSSVSKYLERTGQLPSELDLYPSRSHGSPDLLNASLRPLSTTGDSFTGLLEPEFSQDLSQQSFSKAKYFKKLQGSAETVLTQPGPSIRAEHHGNIEFRRLAAENGGKNSEEITSGMSQRRLSVRECARIQTFPDDYEFVIQKKFSASDGYRMIGNAVPPLLAYRLGQRLEEVWGDLFKAE